MDRNESQQADISMEQNLFSSEVHNMIIEKITELLLRLKTNKHKMLTRRMIKLRSFKPNIVPVYTFNQCCL